MNKVIKKGVLILIGILLAICGCCLFYNIDNTYARVTSSNVYNNVIYIRFQNENEYLNLKPYGYNSTNKQIMANSYNNSIYSVRNYYKAVSNNTVDLHSLLTPESYVIPKPRSYFKVHESSQDSYFREFHEYLIDILEKHYRFNEPNNPDRDNDGKVDALTFVMLYDDSVKIDYNDILWEHAYTLLVRNIGVSNQDLIVKNSQNQPVLNSINNRIFYENYNLIHLRTTRSMLKNDPNGLTIVKNSTMAHEMGHIMGLNDIYLNDYENLLGYNPVYFYDVMAYNHGTRDNVPMFMNSYSRNQLGWLDEKFITEINSNGVYSLRPVNYEYNQNKTFTTNRTVAYRLTSKKYPTQSIYIEYRDVGSIFDNITTKNPGLLVYRIYNTNSAVDNFYYSKTSKPIEIKVFRNDLIQTTGKRASINQNITDGALLNNSNYSMGYKEDVNSNISGEIGNYSGYKQAPLTWITKENNEYVETMDSNIKIKVVSFNEVSKEIKFEINWDSEFVSLGNDKLENAIKEIVGKTKGESLRYNDLKEKGITNLDLSGKGLVNIDGLNNLDLSSIRSINFNYNNASNDSLAQINKFLPIDSHITLFFNNIDLMALSDTQKNYKKIIYGIQGVDGFSFNSQVKSYIYLRELDKEFFDCKIFKDGVLQNMAYDTVYKIAEIGGEYSYSLIGKKTFYGVDIAGNIKNVKLRILPKTVEKNSCYVISEENIVLEGASFNDLTFMTQDISTSVCGERKIQVSVMFNGNGIIYQLESTIKVKDSSTPIIKLNGDAEVSVFVNSGYKDKGVIATKGDVVLYNIITTYYKDGVVVENCDFNKVGEYKIKYEVFDEENRSASVSRIIHVVYSKFSDFIVDSAQSKIDENQHVLFKVYPVTSNPSSADFSNLEYQWFLNNVLVGETKANIVDGSSELELSFIKEGDNDVSVRLNGNVVKTIVVKVGTENVGEVAGFKVNENVLKIIACCMVGFALILLISFVIINKHRKKQNEEIENKIKNLNDNRWK